MRASLAARPTRGIRAWRVLVIPDGGTVLMSPHRPTIWRGDSLIAPDWSDSSALRGTSGIHARHLPSAWDGRWVSPAKNVEGPQRPIVWGLVEVTPGARRVIGTTGWRAESVTIALLVVASPPAGAPLTQQALIDALAEAVGVPVYAAGSPALAAALSMILEEAA